MRRPLLLLPPLALRAPWRQAASAVCMLAGPAVAQGQADWLQSAAALREGALLAAAAARRHDPRSLYLAGVQVRSGCLSCHARQGVAPAEPPATAPHQR